MLHGTCYRAPMLVLGVDPGTRYLGWGLVSREANRIRHVAHGVILAGSTRPLADRLVTIEKQLQDVVDRHRPDAGSVETLFFHKDAQAAAKLGHARGVALMVLARSGLSVYEYQPAKVKQTVAGNGRAGKTQVAQMMKALLSLDDVPASDAADALALAVTHLRRAPLDEALARRLQENPRLAAVLRSGRRGSARVRQGRRSALVSTSESTGE